MLVVDHQAFNSLSVEIGTVHPCDSLIWADEVMCVETPMMSQAESR